MAIRKKIGFFSVQSSWALWLTVQHPTTSSSTRKAPGAEWAGLPTGKREAEHTVLGPATPGTVPFQPPKAGMPGERLGWSGPLRPRAGHGEAPHW